MAFVVAAHRRPGFDHLLAPLLEAVTTMPVTAIAHGQRLEPNTVVLLPPRHDVALVEGRLMLSAAEKRFGWPNTITKFLRSLAIDAGDRSVAVILSGLADDGSAALGSIKAAGGTTFAQAGAEWLDMPMHAIQSGYTDFVLSSENIGRALARLAEAAVHAGRTGSAGRETPLLAGVRRSGGYAQAGDVCA
jgi:two-component system CheB/CheR fusion protein